MTNAIVKQSQINTIDDLGRVAKMLAISNYFDAKGNSEQSIAQIATKILAGQEMGYGPFASVQGIHVIKGRPTLSANLMAAAVKAHPKYDYRVREMSDQIVVIEFFEGGESLGKSSFSMAEATKAGTQNLDKFPRNMLFARAMSNGVRWYCPDVFNGNTVYTPEEFGITVDATTGNITNETTASKHIDTDTGEIIGNYKPAPVDADTVALAASVNAVVVSRSSEVGIASRSSDAATIANASDFDAIPDAKASDMLDKARKAFHATVASTFPKGDIDDARHWFVKKYTTAYTPDNVRESSEKLTANELIAMTEAMKARTKNYRDQWTATKTAPIAKVTPSQLVKSTDAISRDRLLDAMPFETGVN